ncbi:MAG: hypothetical protein PUB00_08620, partial [Clostridiales bacterium]|nr:hypothetical protein [Clostridiales bacterium]
MGKRAKFNSLFRNTNDICGVINNVYLTNQKFDFFERLSPYKPRKIRNFGFFLVQIFFDANTDFDFRMKSKYKVQGFLKKQSKTLHFAHSKTTAKCFAIV